MQAGESQVVAAAEGAIGFVVKYRQVLPRTASSVAMQTLQAVAQECRASASAQVARGRDMRGQASAKGVLREALFRDHIAPIVGVARLAVEGTPQLGGLTVPRRFMSISRTVAAARGLAETIAPHIDALVAVGLASTVVSDLLAAAGALEQADHVSRQHRAAKVHSTRTLREMVRKTRTAFRALDRLIQSDLADNEPALGEWKSQRRLTSGRAKATDPVTEETEDSNGEVTTPAA